MAASDAELLALGRAVYEILKAPGPSPRTLLFEVSDEKRRIDIIPVLAFDHLHATEVAFAKRVF